MDGASARTSASGSPAGLVDPELHLSPVDRRAPVGVPPFLSPRAPIRHQLVLRFSAWVLPSLGSAAGPGPPAPAGLAQEDSRMGRRTTIGMLAVSALAISACGSTSQGATNPRPPAPDRGR